MIHKCNMDINGNFYFLNAQDWQPLATVLFSNVKITGDVTFADSEFSSISAVSSAITLSGIISFLNNTGINGGAMTLYSSTLNIAPNTSVYFYNNTATETGGAIYVDYDGHQFPSPYYLLCFYRLLDYEADSNWYNIIFCNNSATMGGDHVYGALMHSSNCYIALPSQDPSCCAQKYFHYEPKSMSSVSSDPTRVCICKNGSQQCNDIHLDINVYPGEIFTLPIVIVGADFGTTFGSVHAVFKNPTAAVQLKPSSQYIQGIRQISDGICSEVNYTVYSKNTHEILLLTTKHETWRLAKQCNDSYNFDNKLCSSCLANDYASVPLLITPLLLNITLFPCPAGFQLRGDPPGCECHPLLTMSNVKCQLINHTGYHIWIGPLWLHINASNLDVYIAQYCPFDYCKSNKKTVTFESDPSAQCAFDHAGQLCGGCQNDSYALAVGSSHCIHCPNNNLALLVFFAAAGILLVAIIGIFNLTVTQGMINGLIFYANIAWTYKRILFPQQIESNVALVVLRTLMAWLNLDFGIHTCFVKGLNALHKTWPQYFFILYIWGIGIAIIVAASHSMKLTNILGNRPVPILVTLFLLSYTKLLQIIIASVGFTQINVFSAKNYTLTVWSLDGTYIYCGYPHILLFIAALLIFLTLWLPYTLMIFSVQWLRKISHLNLLKWVTRLNPVFDAHLAPLKDKHHYWFGVLLIVRGILLVILTLTYTVYPEINYIMLLITASVLLVYSNYHRVYRNRLVQINENFFLFLLVVIGATGILEQQVRRIVTYVSVGVGLLAFSGITIGSRFCYGQRGESEREFVPNETKRMQQQISDSGLSRDDVLDEIEPLLSDTEQPTPY